MVHFAQHLARSQQRTSSEKAPSMKRKLSLHLLTEKFAINKLPQFGEIPSILSKGDMCFIFRSDEELTIICPDYMAPNNVQQELDWRCFKVEGQLKLDEVGVLASITEPLSEAEVPIFAVSTFTTDYIFVREEHLVNAVHALQKAGHVFLHKGQ